MPIYEVNGQRIEFAQEPSEADIDEAAKALGPSRRTEIPIVSGKSRIPVGPAYSGQPQNIGNKISDFGANALNNFADIGDTTREIAGQVKEHPFQSAGNVIKGTANAAIHLPTTLKTIFNDLVEKAKNAPTRPVDALLAGASAGMMAEGGISLAKGVPGAVKGTINTGKAIASGTKTAGSTIKEAFTAGKTLKGIKEELSSQPQKKLTLREDIRAAGETRKSSLSQMTTEFNSQKEAAANLLKEKSQLQSSANKGKLQELFKNMSKTYRTGLDQAEEELVKKGTVIKPTDYSTRVIDKTLEELRTKGFPEDSSAISEIVKAQESLNKLYENTQLNLSDLRNIKNGVYDTLSSGVKTGNKYAEISDEAANIFLKNHGEYIGELSPGLKALNKEFSPMANARSWASKTFKPYNDFEIQRGASVLERIAKAKVPNKTDLSYLQQLERGSGRFEGSGSLRGETGKIGKSLSTSEESFNLAKKNLIDSTDYKISQLKQKIADMESRHIKLGFEKERLEKLIKVRNTIVLLTLTAVAAPRLLHGAANLGLGH